MPSDGASLTSVGDAIAVSPSASWRSTHRASCGRAALLVSHMDRALLGFLPLSYTGSGWQPPRHSVTALEEVISI